MFEQQIIRIAITNEKWAGKSNVQDSMLRPL